MIECAKRNYQAEEVEYYGFDIFGGAWSRDAAFERVKQKLLKTGARIKLYRGDSTETLPKSIGGLPKMDLIFIDGGHSYPTVRSDWENSKHLMNHQTAVFFHNYDFPEPRKVVENIPREEFSVQLLNSPSDYEMALVKYHPK